MKDLSNCKFVAIFTDNYEGFSILTEEQFDELYPTYGEYGNLNKMWGMTREQLREDAERIIDDADENRRYFGR